MTRPTSSVAARVAAESYRRKSADGGVLRLLQENIRAAQEKLADPNLYARDRKAFDATSVALAAAHAELAAAEDKWLELEILREEIGGA